MDKRCDTLAQITDHLNNKEFLTEEEIIYWENRLKEYNAKN